MNKLDQKNYILIILVFIMPVCGLSIDVYAPFLPMISQLFHISDSMGKLSISIYILGFGLGQISFGLLSDRWGRKKTLIGSLILFSVGSLLITFSINYNEFLILRFIQGIAIAGIVINIRAIVVDLFEGAELRKASVYITTAWTISPIIGPAIGGYFLMSFDWETTFYFLLAYSSCALVFTCLWIPETHHNRMNHSLKTAIKHYQTVFLSRIFMKSVYGLVIGFSVINLFSVLGPYLMYELGCSPVRYSYVALLLGAACFMGSIFNSVLLRIFSINKVIKIALLGLNCIGVLSVVLTRYRQDDVLLLVLFSAAVMFLFGVIYPNYSANCSNLFKHIAGIAAAVRGVTTMVGAAAITGIISFLPVNTTPFFLTIYLVLTAIALLIFLNKPFQKLAHH